MVLGWRGKIKIKLMLLFEKYKINKKCLGYGKACAWKNRREMIENEKNAMR